jgi:hypothetical protein
MHGYEMIHEISDRSGGLASQPRLGLPTLQLLVDGASSLAPKVKAASGFSELTEEAAPRGWRLHPGRSPSADLTMSTCITRSAS